MTKAEQIKEFLGLPSFALVGASRDKKRFGNAVYKALKSRGMNVLPVSNKHAEIEGEKCYPDLMTLPEKVSAAIIITNPANTDKIVKDAISAGITHLWIQMGCASKETISLAESNNIKVVANKCILMFAEPVQGFHLFHRNINKIFGRLYK